MYLSVLRDIGESNLIKVIDASGSTKKDELKKDIKKILKYISRVEANVGLELTIKEMEEYVYGKKAVEYASRQDANKND